MRKLATKYGLKDSAVLTKATQEKWASIRKQVANKAETKTIQKAAEKIANANAENAAIAARIKQKTLRLLEDMLDTVSAEKGTEEKSAITSREDGKVKTVSHTTKLKDIVDIYEILTKDMTGASNSVKAEDDALTASLREEAARLDALRDDEY